MSDSLSLAVVQIATLQAGQTVAFPQTTAGITSGQGNQGSAATTLNQAQSGTGAVQLSIPRQLAFQSTGGTTP